MFLKGADVGEKLKRDAGENFWKLGQKTALSRAPSAECTHEPMPLLQLHLLFNLNLSSN